MDQTALADRETVEVTDGVFLTQLAVGDRMSIQHLRMAPEGTVPIHSHHHEQLGFVYQGVQTFVFEDDTEVDVAPGESYFLPSEEPHGATNRGDEDLLAIDIFSPPRPNPSWLED